MKTPAVEIRGLKKSFEDVQALDGIDLTINQGQFFGLLGPNGAGKTTCFYIMVGLIRPESGEVIYNGEKLTSLPMYQRARKGIGYLPQEPSVFRKLTVEENIMAILETKKISKLEMKKKTRSLLKELNILHIRNTKAYSVWW